MARTRARAGASGEAQPVEESKAQAEFARYKRRVEGAAAAEGPAAPFGSPLAPGAIPAWSLQPALPLAGPPDAGGYGWRRAPAAGVGATGSLVEGMGTTIRLGVDVLNAALASSLRMLNGVGETVGLLTWGDDQDSCCDCCGHHGHDCCSGMSCGSCGCCEPSVGTCC